MCYTVLLQFGMNYAVVGDYMKKLIRISILAGVLLFFCAYFIIFIVFSVTWDLTDVTLSKISPELFEFHQYQKYLTNDSQQQFLIGEAQGSDMEHYSLEDYLEVTISVSCNSRVPSLLQGVFGARNPMIILSNRNKLPERLIYCDVGENESQEFLGEEDPCMFTMFFFVQGLTPEEANTYISDALSKLEFSLIYEQEFFGSRERTICFSNEATRKIHSID